MGKCQLAIGPAGLILSVGCSCEGLDMRSVIVTTLLIASASAARGGAWKRHTIDDSGRGADGVRLADVNGDGRMDIATGWEGSGHIRVYVNPGPEKSARRWPAVTVGKVGSPEDAVFADLDGDGATDVVSSCQGRTRTVYVHWAPKDPGRYLDGNAWKTEPLPVTQGRQQWMFALPMQIDGRGGIDLVVGAKNKGAAIGFLQSPDRPRDAGAWKFHRLYDAGWIMSLRAVDMDGDGDPDILSSDRRPRRVLWLENPGPKAAATGRKWKLHVIGTTSGEAMFLTAADLDADGRRDVVVAVRAGDIHYWRATGDRAAPWKLHKIAMPPGCGTGKAVEVGDVNGDGRNDIVFTCENARGEKSGVRWLSYDESPTRPAWRDHEISGPEGVKFDRMELIDLDGDGDLDVLTCAETPNLGVFWYENPTKQAPGRTSGRNR